MTEPTMPTTTDSMHDRAEHLTPRGAEGAQRGELTHALGDGDRERVGDHEAADEQRDAAEAEQEVLEDVHALLRVLAVGGSPAPSALFTCVVAESSGSICAISSVGDARLGADADQVELAVLVEQPLRGRVGRTRGS